MSEDIKTINGTIEHIPQPDGTVKIKRNHDLMVLSDGLTIDKTLVEIAVDEDMSRAGQLVLPEEAARRLEARQRHVAHRRDLKEMLDVSKKVTSVIMKRSAQEVQNCEEMLQIASEAAKREVDSELLFVDVTALPPLKAAEKVLNTYKDPTVVVPIDLSNALSETKVHPNSEVTRITPIIAVNEQQEDVPKYVMFVVPTSEKDVVGDRKTRLERYVSMSKMPEELKAVVQAYLSFGSFPGSLDSLKNRTRDLLEALESLPEDGEAVFPLP